MKPFTKYVLVFTLLVVINLSLKAKDFGLNTENLNVSALSIMTDNVDLAVNDTFILNIKLGEYRINGNVMTNDVKKYNDGFRTYLLNFPRSGKLSFKSNGSFDFENSENFFGKLTFDYRISTSPTSNEFSVATVCIFIEDDNDRDAVVNMKDMDNDNDGILNIHEGNGELDSDNDGLTDDFDIDSDNDGVPDNIEWQTETGFIKPNGIDVNRNGWGDVYEPSLGGVYYEAVDTDNDGTPDFLDLDSDDDNIEDIIEAHDTDNNNIADNFMLNRDSDNDGLDDGFDSIEGWINKKNVYGSNAILSDTNNNGIRDWRDSYNYSVVPEDENTIIGSPNNFYLYPNPTYGAVYLNFPDDCKSNCISLKVYNLLGREILVKSVSYFENKLELKNLESGYYLIKIQIDNSRAFTQKILVK